MKRRDLLMSLPLPALLWFCLAFSCGSGNRAAGQTTTQRETQQAGKRITLPVQKGVGKPYGSRDPYDCPDLKADAPSVEIAKAAFLCNDEKVWGVGDAGRLTLDEDVTVQVGRGRPYNPNTEVMDLSAIDTTVPVYPWRVSTAEAD